MGDLREILACDVGNSRTKIGLFATAGDGLPACRHSATFAKPRSVDWTVVKDWLREIGESIPPGVVAGTRPDAVRATSDQWAAELGDAPMLLRHEMLKDCLRIDVDEPGRVGIDRLLNAIAVNAVRPEGRPAVVVDCGTATTVDAIDARGAFSGGAILPGFELAARSLHEYTALLPYIGIEDLARERPAAIGRNTKAAIRSGLYWGQIGAVRNLLREISVAEDDCLLLTGGGAPLLVEQIDGARLEPHLTLQGLVLAFLSLHNSRSLRET